MTTLVDLRKVCFACGATGDYVGIGSTNTFLGTPDLDTRPPEMERSTIMYWIQRCSSCGYCAPDVSSGLGDAIRVTKTQEYVHLLNDESFPDLATSFLCSAMIQESADDHPGAGWAALNAAWVCDDASDKPAADECRRRALRYFDSARGKGESISEDEGIEDAILADLLRRIGQFDEVASHCENSLSTHCEPLVQTVLRFELALARRKDVDCYTIAAAKQFIDDPRVDDEASPG